ncbi:hypothetical protein ATANTOWER_029684 [Ataeniobius toweri]|uniref:Uncharacterized protein n=1 Tax=Ataeniobius toweri TaxID=208326 RepID=A0ABU7ARJ1_9TELE|nr:hypothetical protein [Ataeniobius toweri]
MLSINLHPVLLCYPPGIHTPPAKQLAVPDQANQTLHSQTHIVSPLAVILSINFDEFPVPDSSKQIFTINLLNLLLPPECASACGSKQQ